MRSHPPSPYESRPTVLETERKESGWGSRGGSSGRTFDLTRSRRPHPVPLLLPDLLLSHRKRDSDPGKIWKRAGGGVEEGNRPVRTWYSSYYRRRVPAQTRFGYTRNHLHYRHKRVKYWGRILPFSRDFILGISSFRLFLTDPLTFRLELPKDSLGTFNRVETELLWK